MTRKAADTATTQTVNSPGNIDRNFFMRPPLLSAARGRCGRSLRSISRRPGVYLLSTTPPAMLHRCALNFSTLSQGFRSGLGTE